MNAEWDKQEVQLCRLVWDFLMEDIQHKWAFMLLQLSSAIKPTMPETDFPNFSMNLLSSKKNKPSLHELLDIFSCMCALQENLISTKMCAAVSPLEGEWYIFQVVFKNRKVSAHKNICHHIRAKEIRLITYICGSSRIPLDSLISSSKGVHG